MARGRPSTDTQKERFLNILKEQPQLRAGNRFLKDKLKWNDEEYWRIHQLLQDDDLILIGRGRGGSVILSAPPEKISIESLPAVERKREKDYYQPALISIRDQFMKEQGYEESIVVNTSTSGSRVAGGTWTKPDIVAFGVRKLKYAPIKSYDLISFEIKIDTTVSITGFYEALAHSNRVNRSYLIFMNLTEAEFDLKAEAERIVSECEKYGIGLICAKKAEDFDTWDIVRRARKIREYSEETDDAIGDLFTSADLDQVKSMTALKLQQA